MRRGTLQNPHYGLGVWVAGPYMERRGFGAPDAPPQSPEWDNTTLPNLLIKAVVPGPREATPIPQPR